MASNFDENVVFCNESPFVIQTRKYDTKLVEKVMTELKNRIENVCESMFAKAKILVVKFEGIEDDDDGEQILKDIIGTPSQSQLVHYSENVQYASLGMDGIFVKDAQTKEWLEGKPLHEYYELLSEDTTTADSKGLQNIFEAALNGQASFQLLSNLESISSNHAFYRLQTNANPVQCIPPPIVGFNVPGATVSAFPCITPLRCGENGMYIWNILTPGSHPRIWMVPYFEGDMGNEGITLQNVVADAALQNPTCSVDLKNVKTCHYPLREKAFLFHPNALGKQKGKMYAFVQNPGEGVLVAPNTYFCVANTGKSIAFELHQLSYDAKLEEFNNYIPCTPSCKLKHSGQHHILLKKDMETYDKCFKNHHFQNHAELPGVERITKENIAKLLIKEKIPVYVTTTNPAETTEADVRVGCVIGLDPHKENMVKVWQPTYPDNQKSTGKILSFSFNHVCLTRESCRALIQQTTTTKSSKKRGALREIQGKEKSDKALQKFSTCLHPFRKYADDAGLPQQQEYQAPCSRKRPIEEGSASSAPKIANTNSNWSKSFSDDLNKFSEILIHNIRLLLQIIIRNANTDTDKAQQIVDAIETHSKVYSQYVQEKIKPLLETRMLQIQTQLKKPEIKSAFLKKEEKLETLLLSSNSEVQDLLLYLKIGLGIENNAALDSTPPQPQRKFIRFCTKAALDKFNLDLVITDWEKELKTAAPPTETQTKATETAASVNADDIATDSEIASATVNIASDSQIASATANNIASDSEIASATANNVAPNSEIASATANVASDSEIASAAPGPYSITKAQADDDTDDPSISQTLAGSQVPVRSQTPRATEAQTVAPTVLPPEAESSTNPHHAVTETADPEVVSAASGLNSNQDMVAVPRATLVELKENIEKTLQILNSVIRNDT